MEQELRDNLAQVAGLYSAGCGRSTSFISHSVIGDSRFLERVKTGGFTVRSYDRVMQWLSDRWPAGLEWPSDVPRPAPQPLPVPVVASDDEEAEERLPEQQEA